MSETFTFSKEPFKKPRQRNFKKKSPLIKVRESEDLADVIDFRKVFQGIWRHLFLVALCMALWGGLGIGAAYKILQTYQAESMVLFNLDQDSTRGMEGGFNLTNLSLATVLDTIVLPRHFEAVQSSLGLELDPEAIKGMVAVPIPANNSNVLRIIVKGDNPSLVVDIANALAKISVQSSQDFTRRQLKMALDNYRAQLAVVQRTLALQIQDIENFKIANQYFEMDPENSSVLDQVLAMREVRNKAALEYSRTMVQYDHLRQQVEEWPDYVPLSRASSNSPVQVRMLALEGALAEAKSRYTSENPKVRHIEQELNDLLQKSKNVAAEDQSEDQFYGRNELKVQMGIELMQLQGKMNASYRVKEEVEQKLAKMELELQKLPLQQMQLFKLLQAKNITEDQVRSMSKAVESTQLMVNIPKGNIELYQLADKAQPWMEAWWVEFLPVFGLFFGLGFGLFLSLILEIKDQKLRTVKQLGMFYAAPCLSCIPELSGISAANAPKRMLFFTRQLAESIEQILGTLGKAHPSITFVSSVAGEGKSLIAFQLAHYYSRQDKKILYIDFDWRENPFINKGKTGGKTLLQYLKNEASLQEIIISGDVDHICMGSYDSKIKELVKNGALQTLWEELQGRYDLIISEAPGVIQDDYATNVTRYSDLSFFVIGSSQVNKSTVDESLNALDTVGKRPGGLILNRVHPMYISDERIILETKRSGREKWKDFFFWRR